MIYAVLVDDERWALQDIKELFERIEDVQVIETYQSPLEALANARKDADEYGANVWFVDVNMPEIRGDAFAEKLFLKNAKAKIIFVTAYEEYALRAFDVGATDYLLKPVELSRAQRTIARLQEQLSSERIRKGAVRVTVNYIGRFEILVDEKPLKWSARRAEELVAYLGVNFGKAVHRDKIIEDIWECEPDDRSVRNLLTTVFRARQVLKSAKGALSIYHYDNCYRLIVNDCETDIEALLNVDIARAKDIEEYKNALLAGVLENNGWRWAYAYAARLESIIEKNIAKIQNKDNTDDFVTGL